MSLLAPNSDFRGKWKAPLSKKLLQSYSFAPLCLNTRPHSLILGAEARSKCCMALSLLRWRSLESKGKEEGRSGARMMLWKQTKGSRSWKAEKDCVNVSVRQNRKSLHTRIQIEDNGFGSSAANSNMNAWPVPGAWEITPFGLLGF